MLDKQNNSVADVDFAAEFKEITDKVDSLVDVLQKEQELKEQELKLKEEESKKLFEIQQEQSNDYIELLQRQNDLLLEIKTEMISADTAILERLEQQTNIQTESSFMLVIAIVVTAGVKLLLEQISKW